MLESETDTYEVDPSYLWQEYLVLIFFLCALSTSSLNILSKWQLDSHKLDTQDTRQKL